MKLFYVLALGAALLSCGKKSDSKQEPEQKKLLRILSYNIHHGTPINSASGAIELNNISAVIKMQNPDLVALQEVDKNTKRAGEDQAKKLGELLGMNYYFSKSITYDGGEYGVAILSKFPVIATERIVLSNNEPGGEQRTLALITVELPGGQKMKFATAHLDLKVENRTAQMQELNDVSKLSAYPLIVAGDFNATSDSQEFTILKKEFSLNCQTNCAFTFPADKPTKTIDFIINNPAAVKQFTLRSYDSIKNQLASDHLPLLGIYSY